MTINCNGKLINLATPKVMGILNVTPDSFYDGGKFKTLDVILRQVEKMLSAGASFIDLGAHSTRPGAKPISEKEELIRIIPVIEQIMAHFPRAVISVDTYRSTVAKQCIEKGAALINDISAGKLDERMIETVGKMKVPYIMMHMVGTPQNIHGKTHYNNLLKEVIYYFSERIAEARKHLINDIIVDPGFGFSKNISQNFLIMKNLDLLKNLDLPILIGISRKSMIYKTLNLSSPNNALNGTTCLNTIALLKGANILRVHDVEAAVECVTLLNKLK